MIKTFFTLFCILASTLASNATLRTVRALWTPGLSVRYNTTGFKDTSFMDLPKSEKEAIEQDWVMVKSPPLPAGYESMVLFCSRNDYAVCVFTDDTGYVAGVQIAFDTERYVNASFDWTTQGFTKWSILEDGKPQTFWATQQYFVSPKFLEKDPLLRTMNRDKYMTLQDDGVWVSGFNGSLYNISKDISDITNENSTYTRQGCMQLTGIHYFYKMSSNTTCNNGAIFPWYPLINHEQLVGVGLMSVGKITIPDDKTNWFEEFNATSIQDIIPDGPECLYDLANNFGVVSIHIYFIKNPFLLHCYF